MSALDDLCRYVMDHSEAVGSWEGEGASNVHFFYVQAVNDFNIADFMTLFTDWMENGGGAFEEMPTWTTVKGGPSYINWGYWLGSQDVALRFMGLGEQAGLWKVITPATLGATGDEANKMAGGGFVMTAGLLKELESK